MSADDVKRIQAALDKLKTLDDACSTAFSELDGVSEVAEMAYRKAHGRYQSQLFVVKRNSPDWLRDLLAERTKMQAVIEAAEEAIEISHSHDSNPTRVMRMRERLRQALAAWKG